MGMNQRARIDSINNAIDTPKALNNKAQGRRAAAHPGETLIECNQSLKGFPKRPSGRAFV
jgi:hypothetical protein